MSETQSMELVHQPTPPPPASAASESLISVIARAASDPTVDVAKMERLYAMLKEEQARVAEQSFYMAMEKAQAAMPVIVKDAKNPLTNSRYALLETLSKAVKPIYTEHGFSLIFSEGECPNPNKIRVLCQVSHKAGHSKPYHLDLSPDDTGAKGNASKTKIHGEGSTFSYGQRYLTKLIFNVTIAGEDDDGNRGNRPKPQGPSRPTPNLKELFLTRLSDIKDKALQYAIDNAIIMPDQGLESWPLDKVPATKLEYDAIRKKIEQHQ